MVQSNLLIGFKRTLGYSHTRWISETRKKTKEYSTMRNRSLSTKKENYNNKKNKRRELYLFFFIQIINMNKKEKRILLSRSRTFCFRYTHSIVLVSITRYQQHTKFLKLTNKRCPSKSFSCFE